MEKTTFKKQDLRTKNLILTCSLDEDECTAFFEVFLSDKSHLGNISLYKDGNILPNMQGKYAVEACQAVSKYARDYGLEPVLDFL